MSFFLNKKVGQTPLEALEHARRRRHISNDVPLAYAGRLDPMASGRILILVGEECKEQKKYHALDKEYVVEVLLGVGSDTGDILGCIEEGASVFPASQQMKEVLSTFVGPYRSPYPAFSSKTVNGKPLFQWALENEDIERPLQDGTIYSIKYLDMRKIESARLQRYVKAKISKLTPVTEDSKALGRDFRKKDVLASWETLHEGRFPLVKIKVQTSAGVYMRTLAEDIAEKCGTRGLAYSLHRTRYGAEGYFPFFGKTAG